MKKIYRISKWLHKWLSIILSLFLIWMSLSGILLNHPEIISGISIPGRFLPHDYDLVNWNRGSIVQAEYSKKIRGRAYFCGNEGVFQTNDNGKSFINLNKNGYPNSAYLKKTKSIALYETKGNHILFAGNFDGLYKFDFKTQNWYKQNLNSDETKIVKLIKLPDSIIVITDSEAFISEISSGKMKYKKIDLNRIEENPSMTMIEFFFQLHSGELWGLPGKFVFDIAGLILIFLCFSGLYLWLSPKYRRLQKRLNMKRGKIYTGFFYRNHLKIGIWSFALLLVFALTGLFMRPPFIMALLGNEIALKYVPASNPLNPWRHRIRNAAYDINSNKIVIDTKDGYWVSEAGFSGKFLKEIPPVPIFAMGATVLDNDDEGNLLIGSFAGLYKVTGSGLYAENVLGDERPQISSVRPGANLITGYFKTPEGTEYITTHFGGLFNAEHPEIKSDKFKMPEFLQQNYSMSLWNFLFELHNGRIFQALIGDYYILLIPLGALMFTALIVTGVFDWLYLKFRNRSKLNKIVITKPK